METANPCSTVLVADKSEGMRKMLAFMLDLLHVRVVTAENEGEIASAVQKNACTVAFVDLDITGEPPCKLAQQLYQLWPDMTIALMFAYAPHDVLCDLRRIPNLILLPKPFELQEVRQIVRQGALLGSKD